jgi:hypothetical protein
VLVPRRFFNSFLHPPFPFTLLYGPCRARGRPLIRTGRYDVASEKIASAQPPALIRSICRQDFLVNRPTVGLSLNNDADRLPGFSGYRLLIRATALDAVS